MSDSASSLTRTTNQRLPTSHGHGTGDCYIDKNDTTLYSFSGLLDTLTGVLRDVFGRLSDIAQKMLAHAHNALGHKTGLLGR